MSLAARHRDDPAPALAPLPGLAVRRETDAGVMAGLQWRTETEMALRFAAGHRAYLALLDGEPAAFGWIATRTAGIGELGSTFTLPEGERYLWNFVTLKSHRGRGIYPRLLDAVVRAESAGAERFWIAYAPENHASGSGIRKAGFATVAGLSFDAEGRPAVSDAVPGGAAAAARLLGIRAADGPLAPCWRCARAAMPATASCAAGGCTCDYQRAEPGCAA
ncbi:MAG: GNAT family N-acetyltransferase [Gemmatimonadota bacterium]